MESETISPEEKLLINDNVVDVECMVQSEISTGISKRFNVSTSSGYRGIEPYTRPMAYLSHHVIYKGSVLLVAFSTIAVTMRIWSSGSSAI